MPITHLDVPEGASMEKENPVTYLVTGARGIVGRTIIDRSW
jgi:hypothetical protein